MAFGGYNTGGLGDIYSSPYAMSLMALPPGKFKPLSQKLNRKGIAANALGQANQFLQQLNAEKQRIHSTEQSGSWFEETFGPGGGAALGAGLGALGGVGLGAAGLLGGVGAAGVGGAGGAAGLGALFGSQIGGAAGSGNPYAVSQAITTPLMYGALLPAMMGGGYGYGGGGGGTPPSLRDIFSPTGKTTGPQPSPAAASLQALQQPGPVTNSPFGVGHDIPQAGGGGGSPRMAPSMMLEPHQLEAIRQMLAASYATQGGL